MSLNVPTMAQLAAEGRTPEILFWVGCAGSFDDRAKRITRSFVKILNACDIDFAVLGTEESCTGDPAKRAGNEFAYQMTALQNIEVLNMYEVETIVTTCPHCFNILKNEYPELGGDYTVLHHTRFLQSLLADGRLTIEGGAFKGKRITFHDSCYLGRANDIYEAPRDLIRSLDADLVEMKSCKTRGLCCGAGGAQMFKEDEPGDRRINQKRTDEVLDSKAEVVAAACPFCMTMLRDGVTERGKAEEIQVMDLAELLADQVDPS